ncbi:MAG: YIP1 family protein [Candidatus Acidiferrales bacterium]
MATPPSSTPDATPQSAPIGEIGRMTGVLFSPKATYDDIVARPTWIAPLILLCVIALAVIALFGQRVGWRGFMERQFDKNPRTANMPADQREKALDNAVKFAPPITYISVAIATLIVPVIIAAVMLGAFNLLAGTRLNFKVALAIVSFSWMPLVIHGLLSLILLFLKSPDTIDLEHLVGSNPGAFISSDSARWLMALMTSFDIFAFWVMVLMAIGFSAASPKKVTFGKGLTIVVAVWALWVLIHVGWVGAFS